MLGRWMATAADLGRSIAVYPARGPEVRGLTISPIISSWRGPSDQDGTGSRPIWRPREGNHPPAALPVKMWRFTPDPWDPWATISRMRQAAAGPRALDPFRWLSGSPTEEVRPWQAVAGPRSSGDVLRRRFSFGRNGIRQAEAMGAIISLRRSRGPSGPWRPPPQIRLEAGGTDFDRLPILTPFRQGTWPKFWRKLSRAGFRSLGFVNRNRAALRRQAE